MRRGTPGAERFGNFLRSVRIEQGLSMRQVAEKLGHGYYAATVSNAEKGHRAIKKDKIDVWADALGINRSYLRSEWHIANSLLAPPVTRKRHKSTPDSELQRLIHSLNSVERDRVRGYIDALIEARNIIN